MTTIATPKDLWQHLCTSAGLELRLKGGALGRDADIEDDVRKCLSVPATAASLADWLAIDATSSAPRVSTEQLLIAVLKSQGGFALMMEDILSVLITADARKSAHHLSVKFQFDKVNDPISHPGAIQRVGTACSACPGEAPEASQRQCYVATIPNSAPIFAKLSNDQTDWLSSCFRNSVDWQCRRRFASGTLEPPRFRLQDALENLWRNTYSGREEGDRYEIRRRRCDGIARPVVRGN